MPTFQLRTTLCDSCKAKISARKFFGEVRSWKCNMLIWIAINLWVFPIQIPAPDYLVHRVPCTYCWEPADWRIPLTVSKLQPCKLKCECCGGTNVFTTPQFYVKTYDIVVDGVTWPEISWFSKLADGGIVFINKSGQRVIISHPGKYTMTTHGSRFE